MVCKNKQIEKDGRRDNLDLVGAFITTTSDSLAGCYLVFCLYYTTLIAGVSRHKSANGKNQWRAQFRSKNVGHFATQEQAALAYDEEVRKAKIGAKAKLNFPGTRAAQGKKKKKKNAISSRNRASKHHGEPSLVDDGLQGLLTCLHASI